MDLANFKSSSKTEYSLNKKLVQKLRKIKPKVLDQIFSVAHDETFRKINCLECANC